MNMRFLFVAMLTAVACGRTGPESAAGSAPKPASSPGASSGTGAPRGYVATDSQWNDRGVARVEELLRGRFPGVRVFQRDGGIEVQVRSSTTFAGRTSPLYVIDGLAIEVGTDGLLMLSPSDIKKIEVLKDEVSLAQYGMRAGNGVVLITTKRP